MPNSVPVFFSTALRGAWAHVTQSSVMKHYIQLWSFIFRLMLYIPWIITAVFIVYGLLFLCYVLSHPRDLASGSMAVVGSGPTFVRWYVREVIDQLLLELRGLFSFSR